MASKHLVTTQNEVKNAFFFVFNGKKKHETKKFEFGRFLKNAEIFGKISLQEFLLIPGG